ncbi:MAG: hypothetical protein JWO03_2529, partial [Bacteroidetes bacterium]|nr:hypothetical protein [Bacteroidota bacterium]
EGLNAIIEELSKGASPTTAQLLATTFDEKKMEANYSSSYDFFPDHAVKKGDTWKNKKTMESIFPMEIESVYTLKEVKGNTATIGMSANINMKKDSLEMQGMTVKVDIKGSYSGDYNLDMTTGLGTSANLTMPLKGTLEMMNMVVPIEINSIIETGTTTVK